MKSLKVILFNLVLFILSISIVNAEEVSIKSIDLISKSEHAIEKSSPTYEGLELNLDIKFERLNDFIEYKIIIENPTNKDFDLELENLSNSEYITYTYNYNEDKVIKANSEEEILLKIEYLNYVLDELAENEIYTQEDKMYLNFINNVVEIPIPEESVVPEETPKEENPETGTSIIFTISVMLILLILFAILVKLNKPKFLVLFIPILLAIPLSIKANEKLQLKITSNIEVSVKPTTLVKGEQFNIAIKSYNNETINSYYPSDEVIKHFKRSEEAPSESEITKIISEEDAQYEVVAWFDGEDTIYWYSEATRVYLNEDCNYMFYYLYKAEDFELNNFDASKMKKAEYMFYYYGNKSSNTTLDLTNWNVENLESTYYMFYSAGEYSKSTYIDISNWNVENTTNTSYMFYLVGGHSEETKVKLDNLNFKNVIKNEYMFTCVGIDTTKEVFISAKNLKFEKTEDLYSIFRSVCTKAKKCTLNLENFNAQNAKDMSSMISNYAVNASDVTLKLNNFSAQKAETLKEFLGYSMGKATNIDLNIENWNISNAKDLSYMFIDLGRNSFADIELDFTTWKMDSVENLDYFLSFSFMNNGSEKLDGIIKYNFNGINLDKIKSMNHLLDCAAMNAKEFYLDISNWKINNMEKLYSLTWRTANNAEYINFNMSNFEMSNVKSANSAFSPLAMLAKKADVNLNNWKINDCGNISGMFFQAFQETDDLNVSISNWKVNNVEEMGYFLYAVGRGSDNVNFKANNWEINNVKNMDQFLINVGMEDENFEFSMESWSLKGVENMNQFFYTFGANSKTPIVLDLSGWDTSNVTDTGYMFSGMNSLKTIYVSEKWNTEKINESTKMFQYCRQLIGANGTVYSDSKTDKEYARIDTPETPGYFTLKTTE